MVYIRPLANGNFRADVRMKGIVKNKNAKEKPTRHHVDRAG